MNFHCVECDSVMLSPEEMAQGVCDVCQESLAVDFDHAGRADAAERYSYPAYAA